MINYQKILMEIHEEIRPLFGQGKVADYIPELAKVNSNSFGMALYDINGHMYSIGDAETRFSIQSVSKLFTLCMVINQAGEKLWERVGKEPSGNPFNSLVQLEKENGVPRNPFINAGAIVITDILMDQYKNPEKDILSFLQDAADDFDIQYDNEVYLSEKKTGHRNHSLAHFMKGFDNIKNDVNEVLDLYFKHCSLSINAVDLARAAYFLINEGKSLSGKEVLNSRYVKRVNALMMTSGLYDNAGEFAYRVGLPAKSGVGGAIVAVCPGEFSVAVWSPELNSEGNSLIGTKALELLTTKTKLSIF